VQVDEIGSISYAVEVQKSYEQAFLAALHRDEIRERGFSIAVDYAHGSTVDVLDPLLEKLKVDVVGLNARPEAQLLAVSPQEWEASLQLLGALTSATGQDLGVRLDVSGERLFLVDESGQRVHDVVAGAVMADLLWRERSGIIALPVDCPDIFQKLAQQHGGGIVRTKVAVQALMAVAEEQKDVLLALDCNGSFIFPQLHPAPDAMFALAKLLELLAMTKTSLREVLGELPHFYWAKATLACPWEAKGRVMREVSAGVAPYVLDVIDGIRFDAGPGRWALIRPDADRPLLHVVAQGNNPDDAQSLLQQQVAWVENIVTTD